MPIICWTVVHNSAAPVVHSGATLMHALGHAVRPAIHRAARLLRHAPAVAARPRRWVEVVCRLVPAAVVGGGLLAPLPASAPPPPVAQPFSVATGWPEISGGASRFDPTTPWDGDIVEPSRPVEAVPEPSAAGVLLAGSVVVVLIRLGRRTLSVRGNRACGVRDGRGCLPACPHSYAPVPASG
jgi:hypothetical protein